MAPGERTATIDHGGRGGDVTYTDGRGTLTFAWEMASFGIEIGVPTADRWEDDTGLPVGERPEVLRCIAESVIAQRGNRHATFELAEGEYASVQIRL
jgi:hypothetical protein